MTCTGLNRAGVLMAAAMLLLGIGIGYTGAQLHYTASLEERAADGMPVSVNGQLYQITAATPRGLNLSDAWYGEHKVDMPPLKR